MTRIAEENARLRERVASLESDIGEYRELATAALKALQIQTERKKRIEAHCRWLREQAVDEALRRLGE